MSHPDSETLRTKNLKQSFLLEELYQQISPTFCNVCIYNRTWSCGKKFFHEFGIADQSGEYAEKFVENRY